MIALAHPAAVLTFLQDAGAHEPTEAEYILETGVAAAFLLGLGLLQIPLGRRIAAWLDRPFVPSRSAFQFLDVAIAIIVFVAGNFVTLVGASWWSTGDGDLMGPSPEFLETLGGLDVLVLTAAGQLPVALYIVFVAARRRGGLAALGVKRLTPGPRVRYAVARYVISLPMIYGLNSLAVFLYLLAGEEIGMQDAAMMVAEGLKNDAVLVVLFTAVVIPLLEEVLFRGLLLELLVARGGRVVGVVGSSAAFALMHGFEAFLPIFGLAIVLGVIKIRTRSLAAVWLVHGLHNGMSVLYLLYGPSPT